MKIDLSKLTLAAFALSLSLPWLQAEEPDRQAAPPAQAAESTENPEQIAEQLLEKAKASERGFPPEWVEKAESRWTFPGTIIEHLLGERHGFTQEQLEGLTEEELVNLHSNHHIHELIPVGRQILNAELIESAPLLCTPEGGSSSSTNSNSVSARTAEEARKMEQDCQMAHQWEQKAEVSPSPPKAVANNKAENKAENTEATAETEKSAAKPAPSIKPKAPPRAVNTRPHKPAVPARPFVQQRVNPQQRRVFHRFH